MCLYIVYGCGNGPTICNKFKISCSKNKLREHTEHNIFSNINVFKNKAKQNQQLLFRQTDTMT